MTDISYKNWNAMTDKALAEYIGAFIKHNRLEQNITQQELARLAGISRSTLSLLERGETVTLDTLLQVLRVLDKLNILEIFTVQNVVSPILLAKKEKKARRRARIAGKTNFNKQNQKQEKSDW